MSGLRRCIGYTKNGKKCRSIINGEREDKFFCCDGHRPYNMEIFEQGCCICSEVNYGKGDLSMFRCGHVVHKKCYKEWLEHSTYESRICIFCRYEIDKKEQIEESEWIRNVKGVKVPSKRRSGTLMLNFLENLVPKKI